MKLTRFLIADNPMVEGSPSAIIHTLDPQAIIMVVEGHAMPDKPHRQFQYNDEQYTFVVHHLFTREFDSEKHHIIIDKLCNRAWHWFVSYMQWEDEQIDYG